MYFVKYSSLKEKLRNRVLSEREALPYYLLMNVVIAFLIVFPENKDMNEWDILSGAIQIGLALIGSIYCYIKNGGNSGYDYIQKSVVLGWVVGFRCLLVMIPVAVIVGCVKLRITGDINTTVWFDLLMVLAFQVVVFQRLGKHLADTNGNLCEQCPPSLPRLPQAGHLEGEG